MHDSRICCVDVSVTAAFKVVTSLHNPFNCLLSLAFLEGLKDGGRAGDAWYAAMLVERNMPSDTCTLKLRPSQIHKPGFCE